MSLEVEGNHLDLSKYDSLNTSFIEFYVLPMKNDLANFNFS